MKVLEAMQVLKDGGAIIYPAERQIYEFKDGRLRTRHATEKTWRLSTTKGTSTFTDILKDDEEYEIYEEPEEKWYMNFEMFGGKMGDGEPNIKNLSIPARSETEANAWCKALDTFFELKCHPLVIYLDDYTPESGQLFFTFLVNKKGIFIVGSVETPRRCFNNFCYFSTEEYGAQVIRDIGESRLIHMFKTFQGGL